MIKSGSLCATALAVVMSGAFAASAAVAAAPPSSDSPKLEKLWRQYPLNPDSGPTAGQRPAGAAQVRPVALDPTVARPPLNGPPSPEAAAAARDPVRGQPVAPGSKAASGESTTPQSQSGASTTPGLKVDPATRGELRALHRLGFLGLLGRH